MARLVVNAEDLAKQLADAGHKLVIIDFFATWCAPCKVMGPIVDAIASGDKDLVVLKVDINQNEDLAEAYDISAMPTFVFLRDKKVLTTYVGANQAKFKEKIDKIKASASGKSN